MEQRVEAVRAVLAFLEERSREAHADLTLDEYQLVLDALVEGTQQHLRLAARHGQRHRGGGGGDAGPGAHPQQLNATALALERDQARPNPCGASWGRQTLSRKSPAATARRAHACGPAAG